MTNPQPDPNLNYSLSATPPRTSPLAITSFVCGCLLCIPIIPGLIASIFGVIGIKQTQSPHVGGKGFAIAGLILGLVNHAGWGTYIILAAIAIRTLIHTNFPIAQQAVNQSICASNMRQIGQAVIRYSNENKTEYPPDLQTLLKTQAITSQVFVCPATKDTPAPGQTNTQQAKALSTPGHLSYIYLGKGLATSTVKPETIVLYEPLSNHAANPNALGMNVLYGDGHVSFENESTAKKILSELRSNHNPPRPEILESTDAEATTTPTK